MASPQTLFSPSDRIIQLRRQLVLHSYLYYVMNETVWTDYQFDKASRELVDLQQEYGIVHGYKDDVFADWTGDTGFHLTKTILPEEVDNARRVYQYHVQIKGGM